MVWGESGSGSVCGVDLSKSHLHKSHSSSLHKLLIYISSGERGEEEINEKIILRDGTKNGKRDGWKF